MNEISSNCFTPLIFNAYYFSSIKSLVAIMLSGHNIWEKIAQFDQMNGYFE